MLPIPEKMVKLDLSYEGNKITEVSITGNFLF